MKLKEVVHSKQEIVSSCGKKKVVLTHFKRFFRISSFDFQQKSVIQIWNHMRTIFSFEQTIPLKLDIRL